MRRILQTICFLSILATGLAQNFCTNKKGQIPLQDGTTATCWEVGAKKPWLCSQLNVKESCPNACGFCPCKNRQKPFKVKNLGKQRCSKRYLDNGKDLCTKKQYKKKCRKTCGKCLQGSKCILEAKLGYPELNGEPDNAKYKGYHGDWMGVSIGEDQEDDSNSCYANFEKSWCVYKNSIEGMDYAYLGNIDDYYADEAAAEDKISEETITVNGLDGKTAYFYVSHFFNEKDYYPTAEEWQDYLLAATLRITNKHRKKNIIATPDGSTKWQHPTPLGVPTHIDRGNGSWEVNPDYQGQFYIEVTCNDKCECSAAGPYVEKWENRRV